MNTLFAIVISTFLVYTLWAFFIKHSTYLILHATLFDRLRARVDRQSAKPGFFNKKLGELFEKNNMMSTLSLLTFGVPWSIALGYLIVNGMILSFLPTWVAWAGLPFLFVALSLSMGASANLMWEVTLHWQYSHRREMMKTYRAQAIMLLKSPRANEPRIASLIDHLIASADIPLVGMLDARPTVKWVRKQVTVEELVEVEA